jgi:hypothetical protein
MNVDSEAIIRALGKVPEKRLKLIEFAREVVSENGTFETETVEARQADLNLAIAEAQAYASGTQRAIHSLAGLPAIYGGEA